ncbi:helix-turn-helix domain-containing protein [Enterococcus innesii]
MIYYQIVEMLEQGMGISEISRRAGVCRPTVYRIKENLEKNETQVE